MKQRKISISGGFWLLLSWFALANGVALTAMILLAATCHELGHWIAIKWQGKKLYRVSVTVFGAEMETDMQTMGYGGSVVCLLAGVAVNGVLAVVFGQINPVFAGINCSLCLLNLLPIRPLDGGRVLALGLGWWLNPVMGERVASVIERSCALAMALGLGWLIWVTGGSLWLVPGAVAFLGLAIMNK